MKQHLLEASTQKPIDQEQFMLIEDLYKSTEKLEITQEQNMTNKVNIQFLNKQLEKALIDVEKLKEMNLFKNLKKEVETGANGTQNYVIKEGLNKGKIAKK